LITYNGTNLESIKNKGGQQAVFVNSINRPLGPERELQTTDIPDRVGAYVQKVKTKSVNIPCDVTIVANDMEDYVYVKDQLEDVLFVDNTVPIVFGDDPGRVQYGIYNQQTELSRTVNAGKGTLTFTFPDPYKYGEEQQKNVSETKPWASFANRTWKEVENVLQNG
jgi:predicted phage tail component-like protein